MLSGLCGPVACEWRTGRLVRGVRPGVAARGNLVQVPEQTFPNVGCFLEIVKNQRLAWTDALSTAQREGELSLETKRVD